MSIESTILQSQREQRALLAWRLNGALDADAAARAAALLGPRPTADAWRGFADRLALYLGALLLGSGIVSWVAFNWEDFDRFAKLYGMQVLLIAAAGGAMWRQPHTASGRALLLLASIVLGALLALIGQTYQTGADPWQLFAAWAALLVPWALAARWTPLWLLWFALVNVGMFLWFDVGGRWWWANSLFGGQLSWLSIGMIDLMLLAIWETAGMHWRQVQGRYGARLVLLAALWPITVGALWVVLDIFDRGDWAATLLIWAGTIALCGWYYRFRRIDVGALALLCMSVIAVAITALGRMVTRHDDLLIFSWLLLAGALVGMSIAASLWLLKIKREVRDDAD